MANLEKIAHVLDLTAEYVEQVEREKQAAVDDARKSRLDKIAAAHLAAHGEEMPEGARQKLAKTDAATLDVVEELLQKQAGAVESMGGPVRDDEHTTTKQASAVDASQSFLSWIISE